jgi:Zn-dependent protease with chaperone function
MRSRVATQVPSIPSLVLYAATLAAEVPVIFMRMLITLVVAVFVLLLSGHSTHDVNGLAELGVIPTAWAVFALITPMGGGWWWRQNMGGRAPSEREQLAYDDALELLRHNSSEGLREPASWFVIDTPQPDAAVCGNTLMLSRGLLESDHLPAVLAHELGHLATPDGKLTAAINRLLIHPPARSTEPQEAEASRDVVLLARERIVLGFLGIRAVFWLIRKSISFAKGGLGLRITAPAWGSYWREREYTADQYAAQLGQADELADFLEIHALIHDHPVPLIWLTEHTHPPTELRIDKLRKATQAETSTRTLDPGTPSLNEQHPAEQQTIGR